jgi:hypothetical protein
MVINAKLIDLGVSAVEKVLLRGQQPSPNPPKEELSFSLGPSSFSSLQISGQHQFPTTPVSILRRK